MTFTEADIFDEPAPTYLERGVIGWEDADEFVDVGTDQNDGYTLVRVQLFKGRDVTKRPKAGVAHGHQILCMLGLTPFRIPPKGTPVLVAIPGGDMQTPGNCVVIATVEKNPTIQYSEDRVVMDFGSSTHVVIKGKSVTISDSSSPGCFISVGTPKGGGARGVYGLSEGGSGFTIQGSAVGMFSATGGDAKSVIQLTPTKIEAVQKSGSMMRMDANFMSMGSANQVVGGGVYLGKAPVVGNTAAYFSFGSPAPSTSVFVSP